MINLLNRTSLLLTSLSLTVLPLFSLADGIAGLIPIVDITGDIKQAVGYSTLRLTPTSLVGPSTGGAFRGVCTPSHMSKDDPIVYPNQKGAAHHHTFYGNTSTNFSSDMNNLGAVGNSTCKGGLLNRSAYWVPSMINTSTNKAIVPEKSIFYYKTGYTPGHLITVPPKGLRMIAGTSKATSEALSNNAYYTCQGRTPFLWVEKKHPCL